MSLVQAGSASPRVAYASELGCALNSNLSTGGGTDDTAILNAFLATASVTNPIKLIIDGVALISGLAISPNGYTTIEGLGYGTGFYNASGNNNLIISNGYPPTTGNSTPPAISCLHISLRRFTLNGNAGGNANNPVSYGIGLINAAHIVFEEVYVENVAQFCTRFDNCQDMRFTRCTFATGAELQDGLHFNGPAQGILIESCSFANGDDSVALNCPEGYGGNITDVTVTNCTFNSWSGLRCYTSNQSAVFYAKRIAVSNCVGVLQTNAFNFGIEASQAQTSACQLQDIAISNCDFTAGGRSGTYWLAITTPFGTISLNNCIFRAPTTATPMVSAFWFGDNLSMTDCMIVRNSDGNAAAYFIDIGSTGGTMGHISLSGLRLCDQVGSSYAAPSYAVNLFGHLNQLRVSDVDLSGFTSFLNGTSQLSNVTTVAGDGLLSTGLAVPDTQVPNNVLYLSATSGKPSIKVGGTVNALY